jgi:hypothetical protein
LLLLKPKRRPLNHAVHTGWMSSGKDSENIQFWVISGVSFLHRKRSTGLKLERALWIPKHLRQPATEPPVLRALTPTPSSPKETEPGFPSCYDAPKRDGVSAWDPASCLPSEDVESPPLSSTTDGPPPGTCHSMTYS